MKVKNNMQRVLLINPEESRTIWTLSGIIDDEPLDLEMIYTVLKRNNVDVKIFDIQRDEPKTIEECIEEYKPTITYINGVVKQVPFMKEYNSLIKKMNNKTITIVGGQYAEYNYEDFYSDDVDFIARSYDPFVILKIAEYIDDEKVKLEELNGLCYKEKNKWVINKIYPVDIDKLPVIDRDFFYAHKNQVKYLDIVPVAHIRTAYSCLHKCEFCYRTMLNCGKYSERKIEDVVDEIKEIDCDNIYIIDDDFVNDRERILKFISLIKQNKIEKQFISYARVDFIVNNEDIIRKLKEIGWVYLLVGIEASDNKYLGKYNKLISITDSEKCIKMLEEIGIRCEGMMIIDLDFKHKDFVNIYKWIKKVGLKRYAMSIYTPLPGSIIYNKKYKGKIITKDLTKFDFIHVVARPTHMSVARFYWNYYVLVIKLFNLVKKYGTYDFIDLKKWKKEYTKFLFKK